MMITNVKGRFSGVSGTLSVDEQDVTNSKVEVTYPQWRRLIPANRIATPT